MNGSYIPGPEVKVCTKCQVCATLLPDPVLDLGMQPMCDDLVPIGDARVAPKYPIQIALCPRCFTANQRYNINKETLFPADYHYRPRFTLDVLNGMQDLVAQCQKDFGAVAGKLVCDIGCNDGSLLNFFRNAGARTCGIEPTGAAKEAQAGGHHVINDYFSPASAERLLASVGRPAVITFTNVFAHIEDLSEAIAGLKLLVAPETIVVIENHYLGTVVKTNQFDTFYHEHPRTYSLKSFEYIADRLEGSLLSVTFPKRYGGNVRVTIGNFGGTSAYSPGPNAGTDIAEGDFGTELANMQKFVLNWKANASDQLAGLRRSGVKLCGKSFPGRAAILVALLGLDAPEMECVYEKEGSLKLGHYLPGTRVEILSDERWAGGMDRPDALLVWGWHIAPEIAEYLRARGYRGRIFRPLPAFEEMK